MIKSLWKKTGSPQGQTGSPEGVDRMSTSNQKEIHRKQGTGRKFIGIRQEVHCGQTGSSQGEGRKFIGRRQEVYWYS